MVDLSQKSIVVTGGSMGIGLACAEACLQAGAQVMIAARNEIPLRETVKNLKAKGFSKVLSYGVDVSHPEEVELFIDQAMKQMGKLDGVIHAAGIYGPIGPVSDVDPADWHEAIQVNLFGSFVVARAAAQAMKRGSGGRIVLLSGGGAATPFPNYTAYACSKIGVVRLAETMAEEVKSFGIEINCLAPGFVVTRLHQQTLKAGAKAGGDFLDRTKKEIEKGGVPATVAASCAAFLVSDAAKGITGKFVAAPYDGWAQWPEHLSEIQKTDIFTLRRILPKDRGMDWQ